MCVCIVGLFTQFIFIIIIYKKRWFKVLILQCSLAVLCWLSRVCVWELMVLGLWLSWCEAPPWKEKIHKQSDAQRSWKTQITGGENFLETEIRYVGIRMIWRIFSLLYLSSGSCVQPWSVMYLSTYSECQHEKCFEAYKPAAEVLHPWALIQWFSMHQFDYT